MPNTESAKKRHRQSLVRRDRNRAAKTRLKNNLRKFRDAVAADKLEEAQSLSLVVTKLVDQFASKGFVHRNKASRLKSRMSHLLLSKKSAS
jgi:small subunit ribosomal protein S20